MDLITNYPAFKQDINETFEDLIVEFELKIAEPGQGCYFLLGSKCNIRFTYDRGDVSCHFKLPSDYQDSPGFNVWAVDQFIHPSNQPSGNIERTYNAKLQLVEYAGIVKRNTNILNGDFSWLDDFLKEKTRKNEILNFVMHLDYDNPIKQKFWKSDLSWELDVEKYLRDNNINL